MYHTYKSSYDRSMEKTHEQVKDDAAIPKKKREDLEGALEQLRRRGG